MLVHYTVTFEFDSRPPMTHRGTAEGWSASTCASRAIRIAQKALRPVNWSSMNCVLLDRVDTLAADGTAEPEGIDTVEADG